MSLSPTGFECNVQVFLWTFPTPLINWKKISRAFALGVSTGQRRPCLDTQTMGHTVVTSTEEWGGECTGHPEAERGEKTSGGDPGPTVPDTNLPVTLWVRDGVGDTCTWTRKQPTLCWALGQEREQAVPPPECTPFPSGLEMPRQMPREISTDQTQDIMRYFFVNVTTAFLEQFVCEPASGKNTRK